MMNGLFYRGTLTFLPDVLSDFLSDAAEQLLLFDSNSPMTEEFNPASYLYAGLIGVIIVLFVSTAQTGMITLVVINALLGFLLFAL